VSASAAGVSHVAVTGNSVRKPTSHGVLLDTITGGTCTGNTVELISTAVSGIYVRAYVDGTITGNVLRSASTTTTNGIRIDTNGSAAISTDVTVSGNRVTGCNNGVFLGSTSTNCSIIGNGLRGNTTSLNPSTGTGHVLEGNIPGQVPTIASAGTIALVAGEAGVYKISGTTTIDTITATDKAGRRVTLIFTSTAGLSDGVGNLRLSAAFTGTADDAVTLACDGTNWFEMSRSAN
jgi:hypothetical protein